MGVFGFSFYLLVFLLIRENRTITIEMLENKFSSALNKKAAHKLAKKVFHKIVKDKLYQFDNFILFYRVVKEFGYMYGHDLHVETTDSFMHIKNIDEKEENRKSCPNIISEFNAGFGIQFD